VEHTGHPDGLRCVEQIGLCMAVVEGGNRWRLAREGPASRDVTSVDDMAAETGSCLSLFIPDSGFWSGLRGSSDINRCRHPKCILDSKRP
jgi:hypothetical protein